MADMMTFPDTVEEFMEKYKIVDTDGIYMSKGAELVPIFRMRQWFEHLPSAQPDIVRCKDCEFWREHKYAKETKRYIPFCGLNAIYTKSDDFCSKGERRTDEEVNIS